MKLDNLGVERVRQMLITDRKPPYAASVVQLSEIDELLRRGKEAKLDKLFIEFRENHMALRGFLTIKSDIGEVKFIASQGKEIEKDDVIAELLAVGITTEVCSPFSGTVHDILVADDPIYCRNHCVQYGTPLLIIDVNETYEINGAQTE